MTKLQTVQSLPDAKAKLATGEQMSQLQADLQTQRQSLSVLQPQLESLTQQIAALPLQIFAYAQSPYDDWRAQAWAGALVLLLLITLMSVLARAVLRARQALTEGISPRAGIGDD